MMLVCPVCRVAKEPALHIGTVAICSACGSSAAIAIDGTVTRATAHDLEGLRTSELAKLGHARAAITRADRRSS